MEESGKPEEEEICKPVEEVICTRNVSWEEVETCKLEEESNA